MNHRTAFLLITILSLSMTSVHAQMFTQQGQTYIYNGRSGNTACSIPLTISAKGASTVTNNSQGAFTLSFNNGHAGDVLEYISLIISDKEYLWFNQNNVLPWTLTTKMLMPIVLRSIESINTQREEYINSSFAS